MKPSIAPQDKRWRSYGPFVPRCSGNHQKGMKIKHLDDREESNFPRTLCLIESSEPKFYVE